MTPFPTIVVSERSMLRVALARMLGEAGFSVVGSTMNAMQAVAAAPSDPTLVVLDVGYNQAGVVRDIGMLRDRLPQARIALIADSRTLDENYIVSAFKAGLHAYLINPETETLFKCLEVVALGQTIVPADLIARTVAREQKAFGTLSGRELEIARHLAGGLTNKQIARLIHTAEATVKVHVKAILRKIRCTNRTQAATWAIMQGLLGHNGHTAVLALPSPEMMLEERDEISIAKGRLSDDS